MKRFFVAILVFLFCGHAAAQAELQQMIDTERAFHASVEQNTRSAFLSFLSPDAVLFRPNAVNGIEFWRSQSEPASTVLVRKPTYADIASNGLMGYTTGNWRTYQKGRSEGLAEFGQYVSIWEKKPDGKYRISVDIGVAHEKLSFLETDKVIRAEKSRDPNKRGWSPADASMNFLRMSMDRTALGGAYEKFAAADVRLLREGEPPIIGKKSVVRETKSYVSIDFPTKVALYQAADMAYVWNPCEFDNSNEGRVKGNCLHIWKLRDKKWWIVLGVLAPVPNDKQPTLKVRTKKKS